MTFNSHLISDIRVCTARQKRTDDVSPAQHGSDMESSISSLRAFAKEQACVIAGTRNSNSNNGWTHDRTCHACDTLPTYIQCVDARPHLVPMCYEMRLFARGQ